MANISSYLEEAILNHVMRNNAYTSPSAVYCGLISDVGTDLQLEAGTLTNEIDGYTGDRKAVTFAAPTQVGGKATISNSNLLEFEDMPVTTVKYAVITDSPNKGLGNILYWCPLVAEKNTNEGDIFRLAEGEVTLDLD